MDDSAVAKNLMTLNGIQLFDVPNRIQSPYFTQTLFAAAPGVLKLDTLSATFVFHDDLLIRNNTLTVDKVFVDFDNAMGYIQVPWNSEIQISWPDTGLRTLRVRLIYTNGDTLEGVSQIVPTAPYNAFGSDYHEHWIPSNG